MKIKYELFSKIDSRKVITWPQNDEKYYYLNVFIPYNLKSWRVSELQK